MKELKEKIIKILERLIVPQFETELSGFEEAAEEQAFTRAFQLLEEKLNGGK